MFIYIYNETSSQKCILKKLLIFSLFLQPFVCLQSRFSLQRVFRLVMTTLCPTKLWFKILTPHCVCCFFPITKICLWEENHIGRTPLKTRASSSQRKTLRKRKSTAIYLWNKSFHLLMLAAKVAWLICHVFPWHLHVPSFCRRGWWTLPHDEGNPGLVGNCDFILKKHYLTQCMFWVSFSTIWQNHCHPVDSSSK